MTTYIQDVIDTPATQREQLDENQVQNNAGGYSYPVDNFMRLRRFLVLGSEGGSYYVNQKKLTLDNMKAVKECILVDGEATVDIILEMSESGRIPKNSTALYALAAATKFGNNLTRKRAYDVMPRVARTASDMFEFISYANSMRGWGRGLRKSIARWYTEKDFRNLEYQVVKYRNRHNWTHRDVLRKAHPKAQGVLNELFAWVTQGTLPSDNLELINAYERVKTADAEEVVELIKRHRMTWEMLSSEQLTDVNIYRALFETMPINALVRNLGTLTRMGILSPMSDEVRMVRDRLTTGNLGYLHPLKVLSALLTYGNGRGFRGQHTWEPVQPIMEALDVAFNRSFGNVVQTNKRFYLGIDVSGSMGWPDLSGIPGLTPRMASMAWAMAFARREPMHHIAAFTSKELATQPKKKSNRFYWRNREDILKPVNISPNDSLKTVLQRTDRLPHGGTDCALPMLDAIKRKMPVDCFIVITDNETWAGSVHPADAIRQYRTEMNIPAKLVVVGMSSNEFSIADPNDAGMMDVVGFDTGVPEVVSDFVVN